MKCIESAAGHTLSLALHRRGVLLDYIEPFVFKSGCLCLEHGYMHTEVDRQSRGDESSLE